MMDLEDEEKDSLASEWIQWAEDDHVNDENIVRLGSEKGKEVTKRFALTAPGWKINQAEAMIALLESKDVISRKYLILMGLELAHGPAAHPLSP